MHMVSSRRVLSPMLGILPIGRDHGQDACAEGFWQRRIDLTRLDWPPRRVPRISSVKESCRGCPHAE
jgi:hypothetical protein